MLLLIWIVFFLSQYNVSDNIFHVPREDNSSNFSSGPREDKHQNVKIGISGASYLRNTDLGMIVEIVCPIITVIIIANMRSIARFSRSICYY